LGPSWSVSHLAGETPVAKIERGLICRRHQPQKRLFVLYVRYPDGSAVATRCLFTHFGGAKLNKPAQATAKIREK